MSLADAISASTSSATVVTASKAQVNKKSPTANAVAHKVSNNSTEERPRGNSPAYIAYEAKKSACESRMADLRARIVQNNFMCISHYKSLYFRTLLKMDIPWSAVRI